MSKSWLLSSSTGAPSFRRGDTDLVWRDGRPVEITVPDQVLDQRIRKASMTPLGSNRFNSGYGFDGVRLLGGKNLGDDTVKFIGLEMERMMEVLKESQQEARTRIPMDPAELIQSLQGIQVVSEGSEISATVFIQTEGRGQVSVDIPEVNRGIP